MISTDQILLGLLLPLAIAAICALFGGFISRGSSWGATLGLIAGFVLAFKAFLGVWPPREAKEAHLGLGFAIIAIGIATIVLSGKRVPWLVRGVLVVATPVAVVWYIFKPLPPASSPQPLWPWLAAAAGFVVITTAATEWIATRSGSPAAALVLGPMAAGTGLLVMLSGNNNLGLLGAGTAVVIFGLFVATLISSRVSLQRGPALVCATIISALIAWGYFDRGEITPTEMSLLAAAPLIALVAELPPLRRLKPWKNAVIRVTLLSIPIAIAVGLAYVQFKKASAESAGY